MVALAALLVVAGMALGALVVTVYVLVDELTPPGAATRTFAWLVTANNGGIALGALLAGELVKAGGPRGGLWLAAGCALVGVPLALALGLAGPHSDIGRASSGPHP
jgi:predicted MFS family arabinose efflux permease